MQTTTTVDNRLADLEGQASDKFLLSCLQGARRALLDQANPLRLNFFATAMRMLIEHMMDTLAPNDDVMRCAWFKPEKSDGKPTRGQRFAYAIHGGFQESFVKDSLLVDPSPLRKRLIDAVDRCSTRIHAREHNVIADKGLQDAEAELILSAVADVLDAIRECRAAVLEPIAAELDETAVDRLMSETLGEVDELASHYYLQEVYVDHTNVHTIGPETITYKSTGSVDVILQYGSNSDIRNDMGAQIEESFPFSCYIEVPLSEPWNLELAEIQHGVDVSGWRDAMEPEDY